MSVENIAQSTLPQPSVRGRLAAMHPIVPWLIGFLVLLPLPLLMPNAYQQYIVIVILIIFILAVGLNMV